MPMRQSGSRAYDGGEHFHCYNGAGHGWTQFAITDLTRIAADKKAAAAVKMLDAALAPTGAETGRLNRGVRLGRLKLFIREHGFADKTTAEVVRDVVKPLTRRTRCRFVELPGLEGGHSQVSSRHTWELRSACSLQSCVGRSTTTMMWCDIFAVGLVRQERCGSRVRAGRGRHRCARARGHACGLY